MGILYKSKDVSGVITRTLTQGEWDHIAMFIWVQIEGEQTLGVLEALSENGTQLWPWESYIQNKYDSEYSEIVIRHLHFPDDSLKKRVHFQLQSFVQRAINKPYS